MAAFKIEASFLVRLFNEYGESRRCRPASNISTTVSLQWQIDIWSSPLLTCPFLGLEKRGDRRWLDDCKCKRCNNSGVNPKILRHSGIWRASDEAVSNEVLFFKNPRKSNNSLLYLSLILCLLRISCNCNYLTLVDGEKIEFFCWASSQETIEDNC